MAYKLMITPAAEEQFDNLIYYLLYELQNQSAATNLISQTQKIYSRLEDNPYQFPVCDNPLLTTNKYREAVLTSMNYVIIFRIDAECVYIVGIFHQLENYHIKLPIWTKI